jgi:hypothetical protein
VSDIDGVSAAAQMRRPQFKVHATERRSVAENSERILPLAVLKVGECSEYLPESA